MSRIVIPKNVDHEIVEKLLGDLGAEFQDEIDLEIPEQIVSRGFGILTGLYLVVFKWMRLNSGNLIIHLNEKEDQKIQKFASGYFAYLVLSTVWTNSGIVDMEGINLKPKLRGFTSSMFEKIDFLQNLPNGEILLPCFDHYSKERGLTHWLYPNQNDFAATPSNLQNTIYRVFEAIGKIYKAKINNAISELFDDIEIMLWELLRNTDEHAKTDHLNMVNLSPNTRGVFFRINQSSKENFIANANENSGLVNYYRNALVEGNNFIFEISVFDSGPGMAKRYMGEKWDEKLNISDEVDIIKMCLAKGASSVMNWGGKLKGYGLNDVLALLDKRKGFLKIRTGNASIYRDLIERPYKETSDYLSIELLDWKENSYAHFTKMAATEGTLITMAFPLPQTINS